VWPSADQRALRGPAQSDLADARLQPPDALEQSGIVRSDIRSPAVPRTTAEGVPRRLNLKDLAGGGEAFAGVAVFNRRCNRDSK
jgi:hypothetical protein